ncbi:MAG TPA: Hpt domain-containing protein [Nitrospira sp.]|nr:Hpt domain-containing protein [Nitrospira sp.]
MTPQSANNSTGKVIVTIDQGLEEIVPGFLENRRKDVASLETAMQKNDLKTVRLLGHRMKGDGGGYGFQEISAIGDVLEHAAMREDRTVITEQINKLADFLARVEIAYR